MLKELLAMFLFFVLFSFPDGSVFFLGGVSAAADKAQGTRKRQTRRKIRKVAQLTNDSKKRVGEQRDATYF